TVALAGTPRRVALLCLQFAPKSRGLAGTSRKRHGIKEPMKHVNDPLVHFVKWPATRDIMNLHTFSAKIHVLPTFSFKPSLPTPTSPAAGHGCAPVAQRITKARC